MGSSKDTSNKIRDALNKKLNAINPTVVYDPDNTEQPNGWGTQSIQLSSSIGHIVYEGRITQLASFESGGKTTLSIEIAANTYLKYPDKVIVYADMEGHLDLVYVDLIFKKVTGEPYPRDNFILLRPANAEQLDVALNTTIDVAGDAISLIIIDSVASTRLGQQMDITVGDKQAQASHARLWSEFSPKLNTWATTYRFPILLTNQVRQKINSGMMDKFKVSSNIGINYGKNTSDSDIIATGGNTLRFYLSLSFFLTERKKIKKDIIDPKTGEVKKETIATIYSIENRKNKVDVPYKVGSYVITYGVGLDDTTFLEEWARETGLIETKGSFISYKGKSSFRVNGKKAFADKLSTVIDEIKQEYINSIKSVTSNNTPTPTTNKSITDKPAKPVESKSNSVKNVEL